MSSAVTSVSGASEVLSVNDGGTRQEVGSRSNFNNHTTKQRHLRGSPGQSSPVEGPTSRSPDTLGGSWTGWDCLKSDGRDSL